MPLTHRCTSELRSISTPNFSIKRNSSTIQFNREDIPVNSSERKQVEDKRQPSHPELKLSELPPAGAHYVVRSECALFALLTAHIPPSSSSSSALTQSQLARCRSDESSNLLRCTPATVTWMWASPPLRRCSDEFLIHENLNHRFFFQSLNRVINSCHHYIFHALRFVLLANLLNIHTDKSTLNIRWTSIIQQPKCIKT